MSDGKMLAIRQTGVGVFRAVEWSREPSAPGSVGLRSQTLLWAGNDMQQGELVAVLGGRGWTEEEIANQLMFALKTAPEV